MRFDDIEPGNEPEPLVFGPVTRTDIVRYQGASGDMFPIHHDEPMAIDAGLPAPLGIGMFHAGLLATWASAWLGPDNIRRIRFRWKAPVFPGDVLTCAGKIEKKYEADGERRVDLMLTCTKDEDTVTVQGWATFALE